jgi:hypothetical protein
MAHLNARRTLAPVSAQSQGDALRRSEVSSYSSSERNPNSGRVRSRSRPPPPTWNPEPGHRSLQEARCRHPVDSEMRFC